MAGRGAAAAGRALGAAEVTAGGPAAGAVPAGLPSRAVTSASVRAGRLLRLRRACSAAMADLLHFLPAANHFCTSALKPAAGVGAATAGLATTGVVAGTVGLGGAGAPSPFSQDICTPALRASTSASLSKGSPERLRYACSAAMTELFRALRGHLGSRPRVFSSAIRPESSITNGLLPPAA